MKIIPSKQTVFFYASNEPKSVLARDLGDCRDNLRNSRSVFLIVRNYEKQGSNKIREETNRLTGGYYE